MQYCETELLSWLIKNNQNKINKQTKTPWGNFSPAICIFEVYSSWEIFGQKFGEGRKYQERRMVMRGQRRERQGEMKNRRGVGRGEGKEKKGTRSGKKWKKLIKDTELKIPHAKGTQRALDVLLNEHLLCLCLEWNAIYYHRHLANFLKRSALLFSSRNHEGMKNSKMKKNHN